MDRGWLFGWLVRHLYNSCCFFTRVWQVGQKLYYLNSDAFVVNVVRVISLFLLLVFL